MPVLFLWDPCQVPQSAGFDGYAPLWYNEAVLMIVCHISCGSFIALNSSGWGKTERVCDE